MVLMSQRKGICIPERRSLVGKRMEAGKSSSCARKGEGQDKSQSTPSVDDEAGWPWSSS